MKINSCHIENFGKLSSLDLSFEEGKNVFLKNNGWGKSTLASFIRVMFYGFEGEAKKKNAEKERSRFKPWQGGVYGGNLVFEAGGKRYLLTRTFGAKEAEDTFELRDAVTNLKSDDFSASIGEELFKVGSESFMRTVYIGQNDCECNASDDINAKMGNLTDATDDINNFETALASLKEKQSELRKRGGRGSLMPARKR